MSGLRGYFCLNYIRKIKSNIIEKPLLRKYSRFFPRSLIIKKNHKKCQITTSAMHQLDNIGYQQPPHES